MSDAKTHGSFSRMALVLVLGSVTFAGSGSAADVRADDNELRVEHALEAQAQGALSGYVNEVANALVASSESPHDPLPTDRLDARTGAAGKADGDEIAIEHALEARAQGGLSGYLKTQWSDRE